MNDYAMEVKIAKLKKQIIKEASDMFQMYVTERNDWEMYGVAIRGIYNSYATASDEAHIRAMRDVLAGNVQGNVSVEILGGNYGFRVQAGRFAQEHIDTIKSIKKTHGTRASQIYGRGLNCCEAYSVAMIYEEQKKWNNALYDTIDTISKIS